MLTGKQLKVKRIMLDIMGKEVAKQLGVSNTYISLMENGKQAIPQHIYAQWIGFLNEKEGVVV